MKERFLQDLLDAASSSRRHFQKPRKSRLPKDIDPEATAIEPMVARVYGAGLKLNIMTRYWRSRVGQPWDSIWSEVVAAFSGRPDLLDQVKGQIGVGRKWQPTGGNDQPHLCWIYGGRVGLNHNHRRDIVFYVCPKTARLMLLPRAEFHRRYGTADDRVPLPED